MNRKVLKTLLLMGGLTAGQAYALGLGNISLKSHLNEPLVASIPLVAAGDVSPNQVLVNLAPQADFDAAHVDRDILLSSLVFQLDASDKNNPVILVSSSDPIREPSLDFIVELRSPTGRVLREYTVLLDIAQGRSARQPAEYRVPRAKHASTQAAAKPKAAVVAPAPTAPAATAQAAATASTPAPANTVDAAKAELAAQLVSSQEQANLAIVANDTLKKQATDLEKQLADANAKLAEQNVQMQALKTELSNAAKPASAATSAPIPAPAAVQSQKPAVKPVAVKPAPKPVMPQPVAPQETESSGGLTTMFAGIGLLVIVAVGLWFVRKRQMSSSGSSAAPTASTAPTTQAPDTDSEMDSLMVQYGAEHPLPTHTEEPKPEEKTLSTDEALDLLLADLHPEPPAQEVASPVVAESIEVEEPILEHHELLADDLLLVDDPLQEADVETTAIDKDFVFEPELFADVDVSTPVAETVVAAPLLEEPAAASSPVADDALHDATDRDFVVTKLELAKQYLEMSDAESARDLLQEVLDEGDAELKQAATDLLKKIS